MPDECKYPRPGKENYLSLQPNYVIYLSRTQHDLLVVEESTLVRGELYQQCDMGRRPHERCTEKVAVFHSEHDLFILK